jgi:hypothetical protein
MTRIKTISGQPGMDRAKSGEFIYLLLTLDTPSMQFNRQLKKYFRKISVSQQMSDRPC